MNDGSREQTKITAGLDLGDKYSYLFVLDNESGEMIEEVGCVPPPRTSAAASTPSSRSRLPSRSAPTRAG